MSITETATIDIVAARPDSSIVKLVITDHLTWDDLETHTRLLQEKINTYLDFIESGQLHRLQAPKIPVTPIVHIILAVQHPPSSEAELFLSQVLDFLASVDVHFEVEHRPERNSSF